MIEEKKPKPIRRTILLDDVTLDILEKYGIKKSGTKNISNAIRQMAREFELDRRKKWVCALKMMKVTKELYPEN